MYITNLYGVRIIAGISLLSAMVMVLISVYVFIARVDDLLSSKFPESGVPTNILDSPHSDFEENENYKKLLSEINDLWIKYRSVLVSSSMLATLSGFLQSIFSALLLLADAKVINLYIRKWVTIHFILVFLLFIILLNTVALTEHSADKNAWMHLIESFKEILHRERPLNIYASLYEYLGVNQHLIYICVGVNLAVILILMSVMMYVVKRFQGYESYE